MSALVTRLRQRQAYAEAVALGVSQQFAHQCAKRSADQLEATADRHERDLTEHVRWHDKHHPPGFKCRCLDTAAWSLAGIEYQRGLAACDTTQPAQPALFEVGS